MKALNAVLLLAVAGGMVGRYYLQLIVERLIHRLSVLLWYL